MPDRPSSRIGDRPNDSSSKRNQLRNLRHRLEEIERGERDLRDRVDGVEDLGGGVFIIYAPESPTPGIPAPENIDGGLEDPIWTGSGDWSADVTPENVYMAQSIYRNGSWGEFKKSRLKGQSGSDAKQAYLAFPGGDRIKNSEGEVRVVARINEGGDDRPLRSSSEYHLEIGGIKLGTDIGEPVGGDRLSYRIDGAKIDNTATVTLLNGEGQEVFGRTVVDVADGLSGSMRRVDGPLQYARPPGGPWETGATILEGAFRRGGSVLDRTRVSVQWDGEAFSAEKLSGGGTVTTSFGARSVVVDIAHVTEEGAREVVSQSVAAVASGDKGAPSRTHSIHAPEGKTIRNSAGSLPLEVIETVGDRREKVGRGSFALHTRDSGGNYHLLTSADSIGAGDNYQPTIDETSIQGGLSVYLVNRRADTVAEEDVVDAVRLSDLTDSFAGITSIIEGQGSYFESSGGMWQSGTTTIKAEFYQGTNLEGRSYADVTWQQNPKSVATKSDLTPLSGPEDSDLYKVGGTSTFWKLDTSRSSPGADEVGWDPDNDSTFEGVWTDTGRATDYLFSVTKEPADKSDYASVNQISIDVTLGDDLGDDEGQVADVTFSYIYAPPTSVNAKAELEGVPSGDVSDGDKYLVIGTESFWVLDTSRTSPGTGEVGWDPDADGTYQGVWTETNDTPITIVRRETISAVTSGQSATQRYIRPTSGMVIRNADPNKTLGLEIVEKTGDGETVLASGDYKLHYKDGGGSFQPLSNLDSSLDNYAPSLKAKHISEGDLDVYLRNTAENNTVDSISLADVTDSYGAHYVETPNGREVTYYTVNEGTGAPIDPSSLTLTGVFEPPGESRPESRQDALLSFGETSADNTEVTGFSGNTATNGVDVSDPEIDFAVFNDAGTKVFDTADSTDRTGTSDVQDPSRMRVVFSMTDSQTGRFEQVEEVIRFVDDPSAISVDPLGGTTIKNGTGTLQFDVRKRDQTGERRLKKSEIDDSASAKFTVELDHGGSVETITGAAGRMADGSGADPTGRITLDETDISGDDVLRVKKGTGILNSETLLDVADGTDGADAISVSLSRSPEDLTYRWNRETNSWDRTTDTTVTATVYRGATQIATGQLTASLDPSSETVSTSSSSTDAGLSVSTSGENSGALGIEFAYSEGGETYRKGESVVVLREGKNAKALRLVPDSYVFRVDDSGAPAPSSIGLSAETQNISDTPSWSTGNTSVSLGSGSGTSSSLDYSQMEGAGVESVVVTVSAGGLTDRATIIVVREGSSALQAAVTNGAHALPATANGAVNDFSGAGTKVSVYEGTEKLDYDGTASPAAGTFQVSMSASDRNGNGTDDISGTTATSDGNGDASDDVWSFAPSSIEQDVETATVTLSISAKRAGGETEVIDRQVSYAKVRSAGAPRIEADGLVFTQKKNGGHDPSSITLQGRAPEVEGPSFEWDKGTDGTTDATANSISVGHAELSGGSLSVQMTETETGRTDTVTLTEVVEGTDAVTVSVSNGNHTYPADEEGSITTPLSGGSTEISAYEGAEQLLVDTAASPSAETFDVAVVSESGLSGSLSKTDGNASATYVPSGVSSNLATVTLEITATRANGTTDTQTRTLTYSKAVAGTDPKRAVLSAPAQVFRQALNGDHSPSSITLSASSPNIDNPTYSWTSSNTGYSDSGSQTTILPGDLDSDGRIALTLEETTTGETDQITLVEVQAGSAALTGLVTNPSHTLPATPDGAITSFSGSDATVTAYEGAQKLDYDGTADPSHGTFSVSASISDNDGSSTDDISGNTSTSASAWTFSPTSMEKAVNSAQVTLTIDATLSDGSTRSIERRLSYAKAFGGGAAYVEPSALVFKRKQNGNYDPTEITLHGRAPEVDTASFTWDVGADGTFGDRTGGSIALSPGDLSGGALEVQMKETSTGRTDTVTLTEVVEGSDAIQTSLSNESHTFLASSDGVVEDPSTGTCEITAYEGDTQLSVDDTVGAGPSTFDATIASTTGISGSLDKSAPQEITFVPDSNGTMSGGEGSVTVEITPVRGDGAEGTTVVRTISYTRVSSGSGPRIEADGLSFVKGQDGSYAPTSITLTAKAPEVSGTPSFSWSNETGSVTLDAGSDTSTLEVSPSDLNSSGILTAKMTVDQTGATDTATIVRLTEGSDSVRTVLTNENHTYPAEEDGTIKATTSPSAGATNIRAFEGANQLPYDSNGSPGSYKVASVNESSMNGSLSSTNGNNVSTYTPSAINADAASAVINVQVTTSDGATETIERTVTYSKAREGNKGQNAITINLSNTNHTYTKFGGTVETPANGRCEIRMFEGASLLALSSAKVVSVDPDYQSIDPPNGNATSDFENAVTLDSTGNFAVFEPTAMPGDEVVVTVEATTIVDGTTYTRTGKISYSSVNKQENYHNINSADPSGGENGDLWFKVEQSEKSPERIRDVGHFTSTSAPSSSDGQNGDVWFETNS